MADAALVQAHLTILLRPISMMFLTLLLVGIVSGVLGGLILALLSTGFNLALGVSRVVNFQHGAVVLWSMYAAYVLWEATGINPYLGLLLIVPVAFAIGYFLHRWLIIRSLQTPEDSQILFSIGLLIAFQYLAQFVYSTDARSLTEESLQHSLIIGPVILQYTQLAAAAVSLLVLVLLHLMLTRTDLGRKLHACAQNPVGARVAGLNVEHLSAVALGIAAACAAVSGTALATMAPIFPERAFEYSLAAVVVSVLGGMGSMSGSILGGLIVGVIIAVSQVTGHGDLALAIVYALVFLIFLVRPTGLISAVKR
ncbi:branched-chain amino acid ABC transporter, permease protein [Bordetella bronchiseptica MBORD635]|nr:branched-chain amino acid ABC transporter permease [Bordetella bronchiseptica]KDC76236.1 branched-chain amino acid ABC transporter, permease protein [Bordetella bronchiseptica MBORD635]SHQ27659.1 branched-chain amino acid ABC-type transport system [Mycobacteroides abscessus subsp. abscessus]